MSQTSKLSLLKGAIKFGSHFMRSKLFDTVVPFQVGLTVTNKCNLRCTYCYADYPIREHENLQTKDIFKIIDELAELGTLNINLVGGEPLIRKDIGDIIDYILAKGMRCHLTTNGYLASEKLNHIKKLSELFVSIDGEKEENDANRGEGSYEKALEAILLAKKHSVPVSCVCVITKRNLFSAEWLLQKGKEIGFSVCFITLMNKTVDGTKESLDETPSNQEYAQVLRRIIELKKEGFPVLFSEKTLDYALNWKMKYDTDRVWGEEPDFDYIKCYAGKYFGIVDVNGDVYPCAATVDAVEPLNGLTHGFKSAFTHASKHNCKTCHVTCLNENNLLYGMDLSVIKNSFKKYFNFSTGF